jgi:1-deoxyxylulose-5-phosphate synthase
MNKIHRRRFVSQTLAGTAAFLSGIHQFPWLSAAPLVKKEATDRVMLGSTGIKLSRLAMGSGTSGTNYSSDQVRLGLKGFSDLLVHGFDQGVTFWEAADQYGSHACLNAAMRQVGRNNLVLLTKTHARTAPQMRADLDRFRKELGTECIDVVLLHCMMSGKWPEERKGAMDVLEEAREKGIIRAHGVSCHTLEALLVAAKHPWVQVDQARINPIQAYMDADPSTVISVLQEMKKAGKGVIGMKIMGQGKLSHEPDKAIEHAGKLDCLDCFTIGFTNSKQLDEVVTKLPRLSIS